jgi:DNA-binding IclR family transcriptional regulator
MTTAVAGLTLKELAERRGLTRAEAKALLRPFLEAGLVVEREGVVVLADRAVAFAIGSDEREAGGGRSLPANQPRARLR